MKIKASYRQHSLMPLLAVSVIAHAGLFGFSGYYKPAPEYAVARAQNSMEVVFLEEPRRKSEQEAPPEEEVLTAPESETVTEVVKKPVPEPVETKESEIEKDVPEPVIAPPDEGALRENEPEYLKNPAPAYPLLARRRGWQGMVTLDVFVDKEGAPAQVKVKKTSGRGVLDDAAVNAVRKWKFKPASAGGLTFGTWLEVPVQFILD